MDVDFASVHRNAKRNIQPSWPHASRLVNKAYVIEFHQPTTPQEILFSYDNHWELHK